MKAIIIAKSAVYLLAVFGGILPVFGVESQTGRDARSIPITINVIIDGSADLSGVMVEVRSWISDNIIDSLLQNGDTLNMWSAGNKSRVLYSATLTNENEKENIKRILTSLPAQGETADFSGALTESKTRSISKINYTALIKASPAAFSPALSRDSADLMRFSRIEEFRGWRVMVVGMDIASRVRQAVSAYLSGA